MIGLPRWRHYRGKPLAGKLNAMAVLTEYLQAAMRHAEYERLDDGDWYAHIPGLAGLWASAKSVEDTRNDLLFRTRRLALRQRLRRAIEAAGI